MRLHVKNAVLFLSSIAYTFGCVILYFISLWIFIASTWNMFIHVIKDGTRDITLFLDEVAFIVFAIALVDITKYLVIEEVVEHGFGKDMEKAFTKFVMIIVTALCLEGLVLTIEFAKLGYGFFIYPITLFMSAAMLVFALAIYRKFTEN